MDATPNKDFNLEINLKLLGLSIKINSKEKPASHPNKINAVFSEIHIYYQ